MSNDGLTVLVLGDDPANAQFVRDALGNRESTPGTDPSEPHDDVSIRRATTLQGGLDEWDEAVDVVVTALDLPDSTGLETVDALASASANERRHANGRRDPNARRSVPIVVLGRSAAGTSVDAVEAIEHGATEYVEVGRTDPAAFGLRVRCTLERAGTERALRQRNRDLVDLLSVVGHDIRNDVAVIDGWRSVLGEHVDSTERESLDRIERASRNVLRTVETTTDLVEALDESCETTLHPVEIVDVARTQVDGARGAFPAAEIDLVETVPENATVEATKRLSAVFRELLANAIRDNDGETPTVTVKLSNETTGVSVSVIDNGSGIDPDRREAVFGRGERGIESPDARLGLCLVDRLVSEFGGTVEITDAERERTRIEITLRTATSTRTA